VLPMWCEIKRRVIGEMTNEATLPNSGHAVRLRLPKCLDSPRTSPIRKTLGGIATCQKRERENDIENLCMS